MGLINVLSKSPDRPTTVNSSDHLYFGQLEGQRRTAGTFSRAWELQEIAAQEADHLLEIYVAISGASKEFTVDSGH